LPFFDHLALTTTLPAQMALKFKLDIVPIYIARKTNDNFEIEIYDPIKNFSNDDYESNKLNISIKLNKILEEMISRNPGQWIWTHNRWK
jgi:KDO2-lipid IV(A) lauroyltransferase